MKVILGRLFSVVFGLATGACAQTIDFESVPGFATPVDRMAISNQFANLYGVSFEYEGGGYPYLAETGGIITAFNSTYGYDMPASNQGVGRFFLTDKNVDLNTTSSNPPPPALIISYSAPVSAASGVIIDIDNGGGKTEVWRIEARDVFTNVLATNFLSTTNLNAGNALATPWKFQRPSPDIRSIRISFVGTKTGNNGYGAGFAFDNFSPALPMAPAVLKLNRSGARSDIQLSGAVGGLYRLEYSTLVSSNNWVVLTNISLPAPENLIFDTTSSNSPLRFYRAIGIP